MIAIFEVRRGAPRSYGLTVFAKAVLLGNSSGMPRHALFVLPRLKEAIALIPGASSFDLWGRVLAQASGPGL